eukprot:3348033-Ditylum_brightwellii.AAC.1
MVPYLKGIHYTLKSWRSNRDNNGWLYNDKDWKQMKELLGEKEEQYDGVAQGEVAGVNGLQQDLEALSTLGKSKTPPLQLLQGVEISWVQYGFRDTSRGGFGSTITWPGGI